MAAYRTGFEDAASLAKTLACPWRGKTSTRSRGPADLHRLGPVGQLRAGRDRPGAPPTVPLWVQSGGSAANSSENTVMHRTRDQLLDRLTDGGALATVFGSLHRSFSDAPAHPSPLGRHLIGNLPAAGIGPTSAADMARITADLVTSVMGPALNGPDRGPPILHHPRRA